VLFSSCAPTPMATEVYVRRLPLQIGVLVMP
jgi:hypothetical protein